MSTSEMPSASRALTVQPCLQADRSSTPVAASPAPDQARVRSWTFDSMYEAHAAFVWRNARRLGVPEGAVEDVMQEVFLVVHRRLPEFEERTSARAWLSAILIRVVRAHRRSRRTKDFAGELTTDPDGLADVASPTPLQSLEHNEAVRELYAVLSCMNEERREVVVLSELEQLTAPEIADALHVNINTVYWRLRRGRAEFERIVLRRSAARVQR